MAQALRARGANLALLDLDADAVGAQANTLGTSDEARGWRADVRDLDSLDAAMAQATEHFGRLDVVIANAGIDTMAPLATLEPAAFERVVDINFTGVWRTFRAGLPSVQATRGYSLAISSMAAFVHSPLQASYTATKAGVWAMCDSIRLELRHQGVAVGSVHATFFRTPMMDDVIADPAGRVLWGGNEKGLFKMVPSETVVQGIVRGIERRSELIVVPKRNTIIAKAPGLFRPVLDRIAWKTPPSPAPPNWPRRPAGTTTTPSPAHHNHRLRSARCPNSGLLPVRPYSSPVPPAVSAPPAPRGATRPAEPTSYSPTSTRTASTS
uniref:SDR family NAD(P)-dependent oxidoreductase n=1 Tax=Nocardia abscessus TaxID=120957 RepID=UPI001E5FE402|nr:SDR family NAD(P)-dependent oxidoreductase [Nocardia abscessus]